MPERNYLQHLGNFPFRVFPASHASDYGLAMKHCHRDFYELVVVREGRGVHCMEDFRAPIGVGSVFLIPPGEEHYYAESRKLDIYNLLIGNAFLEFFQHDLSADPRWQQLFGVARRRPEVMQLGEDSFPSVAALLDEIVQEQQNREPGAQTMIFADALKVLATICRHCRPAETAHGGSADYKISALLRRLDRHFADEWTLDSMAECAGVPLHSFRRRFRRLTGRPPMEYLLTLRLRQAASLLDCTELAISEIAETCGFPDSNYFARRFRREYGRSPREYRG